MGKSSSSGGLTTALSGHFLRDAWEVPTGTAEHGDGLIRGHFVVAPGPGPWSGATKVSSPHVQGEAQVASQRSLARRSPHEPPGRLSPTDEPLRSLPALLCPSHPVPFARCFRTYRSVGKKGELTPRVIRPQKVPKNKRLILMAQL